MDDGYRKRGRGEKLYAREFNDALLNKFPEAQLRDFSFDARTLGKLSSKFVHPSESARRGREWNNAAAAAATTAVFSFELFSPRAHNLFAEEEDLSLRSENCFELIARDIRDELEGKKIPGIKREYKSCNVN